MSPSALTYCNARSTSRDVRSACRIRLDLSARSLRKFTRFQVRRFEPIGRRFGANAEQQQRRHRQFNLSARGLDRFQNGGSQRMQLDRRQVVFGRTVVGQVVFHQIQFKRRSVERVVEDRERTARLNGQSCQGKRAERRADSGQILSAVPGGKCDTASARHRDSLAVASGTSNRGEFAPRLRHQDRA